METMLKCPKCKSNLFLVREPRGLRKDGKQLTVMVDRLRCKKCGISFRDNKVLAAYKALRKSTP